MKEQIFEIHLADEIPRIGAGRRFVHAKIGYKWVYLRTLYKKARIRRKKWDTISIIREIKNDDPCVGCGNELSGKGQ